MSPEALVSLSVHWEDSILYVRLKVSNRHKAPTKGRAHSAPAGLSILLRGDAIGSELKVNFRGRVSGVLIQTLPFADCVISSLLNRPVPQFTSLGHRNGNGLPIRSLS